MQPLNPLLAAFFKSGNPIIGQCSPVHHYVLLVPTTHLLLTSRETELGLSLFELLASDEFLASHVLKIPSSPSIAGGGGKNGIFTGTLRDIRGKAHQYNTLNGRNVIIRDAFVYTNKGFKSHAQAQLLSDSIWYADTVELRQWLIYYISRPLVGTWEAIPIQPSILEEGLGRKQAEAMRKSLENGDSNLLPKKEIKTFHELLSNFPVIAKQMQPGLDKLFEEFSDVIQRPLPPPPSAQDILDSRAEGPIKAATNKVRSNSMGAPRPSLVGPDSIAEVLPTENVLAEDDEHVIRASLETAVTTAIDIFQTVDKQQLSSLGATTELTGPLVERLIERYVTENVHSQIWTRLVAMRRQEDVELEAKIRQMAYIDISQLGIVMDGGAKGKHELTARLARAVAEFSNMSTAISPQEMMELLLSTLQLVTHVVEQPSDELSDAQESGEEKLPRTVNADALVSLLLYVVIRAGVKYLQARLLYMKHFIFVDDVESGEMGYALSTFEAVLLYLARDSSNLRRASRRNKALWDATAQGNLAELKRMVHSASDSMETDEAPDTPLSSHAPSVSWSMLDDSPGRVSTRHTASEPYSTGSGLSHVFPFQQGKDGRPPTPPPKKKVKRVALDTRSMSSGSEYSYHSRATSTATMDSGFEGDTSVERLLHTHDAAGESIPMMAIQNQRPSVLKWLLTLHDYFPAEMVLKDSNKQGTTLLSAAVQLGHTELIDIMLDFVASATTTEELKQYLALQNDMGRSVAHYLFHAPALIRRIGKLLPWRQRDKKGTTPLFAMCRSYDHADYHNMVLAGLQAARACQGDSEPLHLDEHMDSKGNTLLHIVHDAALTQRILQRCDVDVNATNDRKFTALMVASKFGRYDMVRALYDDARVDLGAREFRGLTAAELAKDEEIRNRIDDLTLFSMPTGADGRVTGVVRSYFVEDATIRLVLKSAVPSANSSFTVTTCRRSMADFDHLAKLLAIENPASWIPDLTSQRSAFQILSKPSRAVLKDAQVRTDWLLKMLLAHPTFATHEMLWEFFLVPDLEPAKMELRSRLKANARAEKVREELEPLDNVAEVEQFVNHARDMVRSVNYATKSLARRVFAVQVLANDLHDAASVVDRHVAALHFLPTSHILAFETYVGALLIPSTSPTQTLHTTLLALQSAVFSMLNALSRPTNQATHIAMLQKQIERHHGSLSRSSRWPLGLLDETRARLGEDREGKVRRCQDDIAEVGRELRYTQQVVAGELAGWQEGHEKMGRRALKNYARGTIMMERGRLEGIKRALRKLRAVDPDEVAAPAMELDPGPAERAEAAGPAASEGSWSRAKGKGRAEAGSREKVARPREGASDSEDLEAGV